MKRTLQLLVLALASTTVDAQAQTTRTDTTIYEHNLSAWVIGQVRASQNLDTGLYESETTYDPVTALPTQTKAYGKLRQTMTYNANGTLATVSDGRGNIVRLASWKRGIPGTITFHDNTAISAEIDDYGLITAVTDEVGATTCYGYDPLGRVNLVTYPQEGAPGCGASDWTGTSINFGDGYPAAYGMPAGHWRQTTLTGNGRKVVVYDALWRPVVDQTLDLATQQISVVIRRYDHDGRLVFESYPVAAHGTLAYTDPTILGTRTTYDALGRPTRVEQDSELGALVTTTEYLAGFKTKVTNPRLKETTTSYTTWDTPTTSFIKDIVHPGDAITSISRDTFGKPTTITRRNAASSVWIRRYWGYNANQELCKQMEVETGTTLMHYDAAGNLDWSATGLPWSNPTVCDDIADATINPQKITRQYDTRNRLTQVAFPGNGEGNTSQTYYDNGKLASITTDNLNGKIVTSTYAYNRRGLLTNEALVWGPVNWPISYTYDRNGYLATQSWHGITVDYAPNALGQPTKAGIYATGVSYHANGAMAQFTYGNGIVHTLTQNARGLPDTSRDAYGSSSFLYDGYDYDANGNVAAISDGRPGGRGNRTMAYDELDRLASVNSPMFNGTIAYTYDATDNIVTLKAPQTPLRASRDLRYCYGTSNRLTFIRSGAADCNSGGATVALGYADQSGNVTSKNGTTYRFDKGNRLRQVGGTATSEYAYDGHGRRVWDYTTEDRYSHYSLDGRLVMTVDERAGKVAEYIQLNGSLLAMRERDVPTGVYTVKYQHTDALGTPVVMTDASRRELDRREYEPYGEVVNQPVEDGPGFTGHVEDAATGLTYMQQRYYDPAIGRFLSVDPVTAYENPLGAFNRYWYANNNPYKFTDPDGRDATWVQNKDGTSTLVIKVMGTGSGANMSAVEQRVESLLLPDQNTSIDMQVVTSPGKGVNSLNMSPGLDTKMCGAAGECTNKLGGNQAHVNSDEASAVSAAAHEVLHFAGIDDQYKEGPKDANGNRTSVPKAGYDNTNIMTSRAGTTLKQSQLDEAKNNKTTEKVKEK